MKRSVLFAMRYADDVGFVWKTIARVRDLAAGFLLDEFDCYVAYTHLTDSPAYFPKNLRKIELDCYDMSESNLLRIQTFTQQNRVEVLVYMSALPASLKLRRLRAMGLKTINTENDSFDHQLRDALPKALMKRVIRGWFKLQLHDVHVSNARSQAAYLLSHYKVPASRLRIVVNGIDCEKFSPPLANLGAVSPLLDRDRIWIICVGQARKEKRVEWMIRAALRLRQELPYLPFSFVYVGDGPELERWKRMSQALGVNEDFVFAGAQTDVVPFYQSAVLMVHAAERESFGLAIVEAMACGLPVVATAAAGPSETIEDGVTGTLVEMFDEDGFCQAIKYYLLHPDVRLKIGMAARERVLAMYSINRQASEFADIIRSCCPARSPGR